jgi:hypothetical protein
LRLPQASQAGGGAEFPGFSLLVAGDAQGLMKAVFCLKVTLSVRLQALILG